VPVRRSASMIWLRRYPGLAACGREREGASGVMTWRVMTWRRLFAACSAALLSVVAGGALAQTPAPAPPPTPVPFDDAVLRAANDLFSKATLPEGGAKVELVIDPLIDGISGAQSTATRLMGDRIAALVKQTYPRFNLERFSTETLSRSPIVLIG